MTTTDLYELRPGESYARCEDCSAVLADPEAVRTHMAETMAASTDAGSALRAQSHAALAQALEDRDRPVTAALIRLAETDQRIYDRFVGPLLDQLENAATSAGAQIMTAEPSTRVRA